MPPAHAFSPNLLMHAFRYIICCLYAFGNIKYLWIPVDRPWNTARLLLTCDMTCALPHPNHPFPRPCPLRPLLPTPATDCTIASNSAPQLCRDVSALKRALLRESDARQPDVDVVALASRLDGIGYAVSIRTALGGGDACFRNLRNEFLCVAGEGDFEGVTFVVEPFFREHFEIPHATATYRAVLAATPEVYVGTSAHLVPLLQLLCAQMKDCFDDNGLTLPPWRRAAALQSKWLPRRSRDTRVSSPAGCSSPVATPRAAAAASSDEDRCGAALLACGVLT